jgi:ABC-type multidrug transport system fused ATPase/permease subunit
MESSLIRFILRHSLRQQIAVVVLTLVSFPFLYYSLDLPKTIINQAIGGKNLPKDVFGVPVDQISYLMVLSGVFLLLVFVNGGFKYAINVFKGRLGERMLRRFRYELYSRILRFPLGHFRRVSQGELIPMITAEVEPLGGYIGDAIAQPIFQGGTLLTIVVFMFIQDPILGAAAISLYPIQGYIIPKLQRRVNRLGKERVKAVRKLAEQIGESVSGVQEIRAHDNARWQLSRFTAQLGVIYDIRYEIFKRKFFVKFLNNFINQLTPFFFYAIGGYLVIQGSLSFGALVAVLAAYKDLASPWKELLDYYQQKEDNRIRRPHRGIAADIRPDAGRGRRQGGARERVADPADRPAQARGGRAGRPGQGSPGTGAGAAGDAHLGPDADRRTRSPDAALIGRRPPFGLCRAAGLCLLVVASRQSAFRRHAPAGRRGDLQGRRNGEVGQAPP